MEWFNKNLINSVVHILLNNDAPRDIIVREDFYDPCLRAINDPKVSMELPEGVTTEQVEKELKENFFPRIQVRPFPAENMRVNNPQFPRQMEVFQIITQGAIEKMFLDQWDQRVGFSQALQSIGSPFMPSMQEKRLLFFLLTALEQFQNTSSKIELARGNLPL